MIVPYFVSFYRENKRPISAETAINALYSFYMHRMGPIAGLGTTDYTGFINTKNSSDPFPDIQIHNFYYRIGSDHFHKFLDAIGFNEEIEKSLREAYEEGNIVAYYLVLLKQDEPGKIELRSTDPLAPPKIFPNYLQTEREIEALRQGIRVMQKLYDTTSYKQAEAKEIHVKISECDKLKYDSDEYWECYIRYTSSTLYHPVGTAKMGPDSDADAVLDPQLRVRNVKNLRVIDASVMPIIPSANTNAASIMIGEKGADYIKESWSGGDAGKPPSASDKDEL